MGIAWFLAALLVVVSLRWASAGWVRRYEGVAAAALLLFGALAGAPPSAPDGRVTLEGFALSYPEPAERPILRLGPASDDAIPGLRMPGAPVVAVDLSAAAPDASGSSRLTLDVPAAQPVLVGFEPPSSQAPPFANLHPLRGGEILAICPGGSRGCPERRLAVAALEDGGFRIGPCDLSGERDAAGDGERIVTLLDLYHYREDACVPRRIDPATAFWARRSEGGSPVLPMHSFLLVRDDGVWLALLDGANLLAVEGLGPSEAVIEVQGAGPFTLSSMQLLPSVPFDDLYRETFDPGFSTCERGYAGAEADLSGARLCKRVRVHYRTRRLTLHPAADALYVLPEEPSSITVSPGAGDEREAGEALAAVAYTSSAQLSLDTESPLLSFPYGIEGGEPMAVRLALSADPADCPSLPTPCVHTRSPSGSRAFAPGAVMQLGDTDGERHLLRMSSIGLPTWLALALVGLFGLQASLLEAPRGRGERAIVAALLVLLAARALFGFKVMARYPHDAEGLLSAVAGAVVLPVALALAGRRTGRWLGAAGALVAGALLWGALVLQGALPAPALEGDYPSLLLGLVCLLGAAAGFGVLAGRRDDGALPGSRRLLAVATAGFVLLVVVRFGFAVLGRERLGDFQLILLYWPLMLASLMPLVAWWRGRNRADGGWLWALGQGLLLLGLLLVPSLAQAVPAGDKGAALVVFPPMVLAATLCWWPSTRAGSMKLLGVLGALVLLGLGVYLGQRALLDRAFPPVAQDAALWETDARGRACPTTDPSVDDPFSLARFPRIFDRGNIGLRLDEWFLPGASNRAGTRDGAQVHESLTILQRYAAGRDASPGGSGYLTVPIRRYGAAEVDAQLFDGVPSVLVASEGGTLALAGLLLLHLALAGGVAWGATAALEDPDPTPPGRSALVFGMVTAALIPAWATWLMVGNNLGLFPFTGQCTPLLGVLSGTDLLLAPVLWCLAVALARAIGDGGEHDQA